MENTFCSISEMVDHIFPLLAYFKHIIQRIHWPSITRIPNVRIPLLFIVGMSDEIVPPAHVMRLHEAASNAPFKQIYQVQGGMHNDTWYKGGKDYIYAIKDFVDKAGDHRSNRDTQNNRNSFGNNSGPNMPNQGGVGTQGVQLRRGGHNIREDFN